MPFWTKQQRGRLKGEEYKIHSEDSCMPHKATIELFRNDMKFSSAHFTIFNRTERERLHGHNYYVHSVVEAYYIEPGITYDYSDTRKQIISICRSLNEYMLLPQHSPYLKIIEENEFYKVLFHTDTMYFLKKDTLILPLMNITSEELARYFVEKLCVDEDDLRNKKIASLNVSVSTTLGQRSGYLRSF